MVTPYTELELLSPTLLTQQSLISIDGSQLVKTVSQMNNSRVEELLIPQGKGNAILCTGKVGIRCSQDITTLLRQTLKTDENAVIIQLNDVNPLQNNKILLESKVLRDITNYVNIAQEQVVVYKKNESIEGSQQEAVAVLDHVHATRTNFLTGYGTGTVAPMLVARAPSLSRKLYIGRPSGIPSLQQRSINPVSQLRAELLNYVPLGVNLVATRAKVQETDLVTSNLNLLDLNESQNTEVFSEDPEILSNILEQLEPSELLKRESILDKLISGMPETSYLKTDSNIQKKFRETFIKLPTEQLILILDKQERMIEYIARFRTDDQLKSELLKKLKIDKNFLIDTDILKVNTDSLENLEIFLEKLASKSYLLPFIIGCALPYNQLSFSQDWFTKENLLPNLIKIQDTVLTTQSFGSFNSTGKMTKIAYENVLLNLSTLIKGATFFIQYCSKTILEKDHVLIQRIAKVLMEGSLFHRSVLQISELGLGRGEFENNDTSEAYFSTGEANQYRTIGTTMSLPRKIEPNITLMENIQSFHDTTIVHPRYIRATIEMEVMCGGAELDNTFLEKCALNNLLAEAKVGEFLYTWALKPALLETVFFDIDLLCKSNKKCMHDNLLKGPFSYTSILEAAQAFGQYVNALRFLIVAYSNNLAVIEILD